MTICIPISNSYELLTVIIIRLHPQRLVYIFDSIFVDFDYVTLPGIFAVYINHRDADFSGRGGVLGFEVWR